MNRFSIRRVLKKWVIEREEWRLNRACCFKKAIPFTAKIAIRPFGQASP